MVPGDPGSPVLYVLDSFFLFDLAVGAAALLRAGARVTGGPFPALTTVGIGYPTADPMEVFALRARDLTPTDGRASTGIELPPLRFGGAEGFLSALVDEVIPSVEGRYSVDDRRRAVAGFSFSGLFGLYVLFHRPEVFSSYLVGSPSLWWDDGLAFGWEEAWARGNDDLAARVFLSIGSNEALVDGKNEALVAVRGRTRTSRWRRSDRLRGTTCGTWLRCSGSAPTRTFTSRPPSSRASTI